MVFEHRIFNPHRYNVEGKYEIFVIVKNDEEDEYLDLDNPEDDKL